MKTRTGLFALITALLLLCAPAAFAAPETADTAPTIEDAKAAVLVEYSTGKILYEMEADRRLPVASMTKMMTLCILFDKIDAGQMSLEDEVQISPAAAAMDGSEVFLEEGKSYKARELIKSVIIASGNDACVALAEHAAGSESGFTALMNKKAEQLGMKNTHFSNCTGMPAAEHYSTARDMAVLARELAGHELFFSWSGRWMDKLEHSGGRVTELVNTNRLVRFFDGCDGMKTGYTAEAGHCVTATVKKGNMRLISVIIGAGTGQGRFDDARALINYGFAEFTLVKKEADIAKSIELKGGYEPQVQIEGEPLCAVLSKREAQEAEVTAELEQSVKAPVRAGDRVGRLSLVVRGQTVAQAEIKAAEDCPEATVGGYFLKMAAHW